MQILNYDNQYDILSISFAKTGSYANESYDGIEVFHSLDTDEITGLMIYNFMKRYADKSLFNVSFPVSVDLDTLARKARAGAM